MTNQLPPEDLAFRLGMLRRQRNRLHSVMREISQLRADLTQGSLKLVPLIQEGERVAFLDLADPEALNDYLDLTELDTALAQIDLLIEFVTAQLPRQHSDFFVPPTQT
jgi:hypothetical protein